MKTQRVSSLEARRLRTRFTPKSRIGQGLVSTAPWIDVVLVIVLFALLEKRLVLQPGVVVDLPRAPFTEGTQSGLIAVILSVGGGNGRGHEQVVFFDDERFLVGDEEQETNLKQTFRHSAGRHPEWPLVIQADASVPHGIVQKVIQLAGESGVTRVNVATQPF